MSLRAMQAFMLVLVLAPAAAGAPVADYIGKPVVSVTLQIEGREAQDQVLIALIETRVGRPLSMAEVRESIVHLFGLGRFQDIQVDASLAAGGVALVYELVPLHLVERLEFRGNLGLSESVLRRAVVERFGAAPAIGRATAAAERLEELYRDSGYLAARLVPRAEVEHAPERTILVFEANAGPRARIADIEIQGMPLGILQRTRLLDRLDVQSGGYYERAALDRRLDEYVAQLRSQGYYEARSSHAVSVREGGQAIDLVVRIEAGPHVTVSFEGDPLPDDQRTELVPIEREGSADEDLLEDSARRITEFLNEQGYWRARVDHARTPTDNELQIVFKVRRGRQYLVGSVQIGGGGNQAIPLSELQALIELKPGEPFVESRFDADAARVRELYLRRGFANVKVDPAVNEPAPADPASPSRVVVPTITIHEDVRTRVGSIAITGNTAVSEGTLRGVMALTPGVPFYRPQLALDREAVLLEYLNRGYQNAAIEIETQLGPDRTSADLVVKVREGPQFTVDHVIVVGNRRTSAATIERELALRPGDPLSLSGIVESQRRLGALGLFRRVRIAEIAHTGGARHDLVVTVEEAPATTIGYGGGLEAGARLRRGGEGAGRAEERLEFAPRGFFEIGRRNLWGTARSIDLFTRISVRPKDAPDDPARDGRGVGFSEYRVIGTYREPRAFGWNADGVIIAFLEQAIRSSFNLNRRGVSAELTRRLARGLSISGRYGYDQNRLFDERFNQADKPLIDRLFPEVSLSSVSSALVRDTRDDPVDPIRGELLSVDGELAARRIGSEVGFVRTFLQGFVYRRLPGTRRAVVATGARLGLASGFSREVVRLDEQGRPIVGPGGSPLVDIVDEIPASERFFAGGDSTVRGFAHDRLGTPATIDQDGFPKGGNALVVLNAELRVPVWRDLGAVAFLDAGNVYARANDLDLGEIRGGIGFGVRYRSPVGPIRVDLGFKLDRRDREGRAEVHVSIGQAF